MTTRSKILILLQIRRKKRFGRTQRDGSTRRVECLFRETRGTPASVVINFVREHRHTFVYDNSSHVFVTNYVSPPSPKIEIGTIRTHSGDRGVFVTHIITKHTHARRYNTAYVMRRVSGRILSTPSFWRPIRRRACFVRTYNASDPVEVPLDISLVFNGH